MVKHLKGKKHKRAADLQTKSEMGAEANEQNVVNVVPFFQGIVTMEEKDREPVTIKFNSALYLAKIERPFSDYDNLL